MGADKRARGGQGTRLQAGRDPEPSAAMLDSQRVQTTEDSGVIKGYDGGKPVKGRKRHGLVDMLGRRLSVSVTPATTSDQEGARRRLSEDYERKVQRGETFVTLATIRLMSARIAKKVR